jgi:hypothetical protein
MSILIIIPLILIGLLVLAAVIVSVMFTIHEISNNPVPPAENKRKFFVRVVMILSYTFLGVFFCLIPVIVTELYNFPRNSKMHKRVAFNIATRQCGIKSDDGSWKIKKRLVIRFWYEAEHILHRNRWRMG